MFETNVNTLFRFKHVPSALHPEAVNYFWGNKYHRLYYFILVFNNEAEKIFSWEHGAFDWGIIYAWSRYCPARM